MTRTDIAKELRRYTGKGTIKAAELGRFLGNRNDLTVKGSDTMGRTITTARWIPDPKQTQLAKIEIPEELKPQKVIEYIPMKAKKRKHWKPTKRDAVILVSAIAPLEFCVMYTGVFLMEHYKGWFAFLIASLAWFCFVVYANITKRKDRQGMRRSHKNRKVRV